MAVDDVGDVVNALTLSGQIHASIVQGAGQALMENIVYAPENGQILSGSLMDYRMPRADDFCSFALENNPVPAIINAVNHALANQNIRHL